MQTFLPFPNFKKSAYVLDCQRLGKQRVEVLQILNAMTKGKGWANHPATKMWMGYEDALKAYGNACICDWIERGYSNNMPLWEHGDIVMPPWFGDEDFHKSHQSNLLRKDAEFYGSVFPGVPDNLPYIWPA